MLSKKRAISTVLTTVIILVSSVILGSGVVLYGTSLFQGGTQTESILVTDISLWVDDTDPGGIGIGWGAVSIRNTGDKEIAVNRILVRGSEIPHTQWYPDTEISTLAFQQNLNHTGWDNQGANVKLVDNCASGSTYINIDPDGNGPMTECISADAASSPVSLSAGSSAVIYFKLSNDTITSLDSGLQTNVGIFAGSAGAPYSVTILGTS